MTALTNETQIAVIGTNVEAIKSDILEIKSNLRSLGNQFVTPPQLALVQAEVELLKENQKNQNTFIKWLLGIVTVETIGLMFQLAQNYLIKGN